jgi:adenylosuccinate lyase
MIPRYSLPEMALIWSDEYRYRTWLRVETEALAAMVEHGLAPASALEALRKKGNFDVERIAEIEQEVKHDVIAFLTNLAEYVGPESRFIHRGMTSSDLLDTSFALQLCESADLILTELGILADACWQRANQYKNLITIGRSHGVHAEPTSFGLKILTWYAELKRAQKRIEEARKEIQACKLAVPVGTFAALPPMIEESVAE